METVFLPVIVFLLVYVALTLELINKAAAALSGVAVLLIFGTISEHQAVGMIDFETIMLLMGMMIIVSILRRSGFFTLVSVKIAEFTKGNPVKILILFSLVTAVMSAFLDNVTTVLIIIPILIELTRGIGLDPKPYIISQALISNVGGTATLIGDPPNIIIGSQVGLTFNQFLINLSIPVVIVFTVVLLYIRIRNRDRFQPVDQNLVKQVSIRLLLEKIRFEFMNTRLDRRLIVKALCCLALALSLFVTQTITGLSPGLVAFAVAMLLFVLSGEDVEQVLEDVEWSTLLFFAGLFILVGVLEERGVILWIAENVFMRIGNNPYVMVLVVLWVSGLVSGFLDNIPFTVSMIPIVEHMLQTTPVPNNILWWALSLGACLGGNFTYIGASANIVSVSIAQKYGEGITFLEFMKTGAAVTIIALLIASIYLTIYLWASL